MAAKVKKGDKVVVLTGRDKGRTGEVIQVMPKEDRALVRGINLVKRHTRQTQTSEAGSSPRRRRSTCRTWRSPTPRTASPPGLVFAFWKTGARFASRSAREI
jgi:large subunit ribosomal protein L24